MSKTIEDTAVNFSQWQAILHRLAVERRSHTSPANFEVYK